ncbi:MAG TPA: DUF1344 domain-containing protein [Candidatus Methylomirabilis sp.]|nr:DUF1344 domain-containing protein [Candidatus Methylomirabilis sp.]
MRQAILALVFLGLPGASAGAQMLPAPPAQVTLSDGGLPQAKAIQGTIKALDRAQKTLTLEDGTALTIPEAVKVTPGTLRKGAEVTAAYEEQDGLKVIIALDVWPPSQS